VLGACLPTSGFVQKSTVADFGSRASSEPAPGVTTEEESARLVVPLLAGLAVLRFGTGRSAAPLPDRRDAG
jgi:hypothetical protein